MRVNLNTPFAEKDAVKALGARWDAANKLWYIKDVADLTPFMRWIPVVQVATERPATNSTVSTCTAAKLPANQSGRGAITQSSKPIPHCGCTVLPWEPCEHTAIG